MFAILIGLLLIINVLSSVVILTEAEFEKSVGKGFWMIKYFAVPVLVDEWDALALEFSENADVHIASVSCSDEQEICITKGVSGYPTIKFYDNGKEIERYYGSRSLEAFSQYIRQKTSTVSKSSEKETTGSEIEPKSSETEL